MRASGKVRLPIASHFFHPLSFNYFWQNHCFLIFLGPPWPYLLSSAICLSPSMIFTFTSFQLTNLTIQSSRLSSYAIYADFSVACTIPEALANEFQESGIIQIYRAVIISIWIQLFLLTVPKQLHDVVLSINRNCFWQFILQMTQLTHNALLIPE